MRREQREPTPGAAANLAPVEGAIFWCADLRANEAFVDSSFFAKMLR